MSVHISLPTDPFSITTVPRDTVRTSNVLASACRNDTSVERSLKSETFPSHSRRFLSSSARTSSTSSAPSWRSASLRRCSSASSRLASSSSGVRSASAAFGSGPSCSLAHQVQNAAKGTRLSSCCSDIALNWAAVAALSFFKPTMLQPIENSLGLRRRSPSLSIFSNLCQILLKYTRHSIRRLNSVRRTTSAALWCDAA